MAIHLRRSKSGGWIVPVTVTPKSAKNELCPVQPEDETLRIKVTVAPEKGQANKAVLQVLAKALKIPVSQCAVVRGETARQKQIELQLLKTPDSVVLYLSQMLSVPSTCFIAENE
jgi:uncharacterized protein